MPDPIRQQQSKQPHQGRLPISGNLRPTWMPEDLLQIRAPGVSFYVLRDSKGLYLIDGGFIGGRRELRRELKKQGSRDTKSYAG